MKFWHVIVIFVGAFLSWEVPIIALFYLLFLEYLLNEAFHKKEREEHYKRFADDHYKRTGDPCFIEMDRPYKRSSIPLENFLNVLLIALLVGYWCFVKGPKIGRVEDHPAFVEHYGVLD